MATANMVFSAKLVDGFGTIGAARAYYAIDDSISVATLIGHLNGWVLDLDGVIGGGILGSSVRIEEPQPGLHGADAASRMEQTGIFNFSASGTTKRFGVVIPSFRDILIVGGRINLANAAVSTLVTDLGSGNFTNEKGQVLLTLRDAFLAYHKFRKQLQRSSFEV